MDAVRAVDMEDVCVVVEHIVVKEVAGAWNYMLGCAETGCYIAEREAPVGSPGLLGGDQGCVACFSRMFVGIVAYHHKSCTRVVDKNQGSDEVQRTVVAVSVQTAHEVVQFSRIDVLETSQI